MIKQIVAMSGISISEIEYTPFGIDVEKFKPISKNINTYYDELIFGTVKSLEKNTVLIFY